VPLGVMIARRSIVTWPKGSHGNTYGGNPIACAAALATLELVEREYMQNAAEVGAYILDVMEEIRACHPSIGDVRGKGLMIGVEFVQDHGSKAPAEALRDRIVDLAFEHGLLMLGCGKSVIRISPPLCLTKAEADEGLNIFAHVIGMAEKGM
jgi:4-aminobutyrate aminotransferase